jgi:uncharacterized protein (TIGR02118 family)
MRAHPGPLFEMVNKCWCALDALARDIKHADYFFCDSVEAFHTGLGPHTTEIMADIPNYTDQAPLIQISEAVVG